MTNAYSSGLQSTFDKDGNDLGWGEDSTVAMIKHFPGDGSAESGREAHNAYGKFNVYPGNNFKAHLVPFIDGGRCHGSGRRRHALLFDCLVRQRGVR